MKLKSNLKSVKTTVLGIIAGLMIILPQLQNLLDGNPETTLNETVLITGLSMMGLGIFSKDGDKSTEDVT